MIKAIRLNGDGSPVKGSETKFTEAHWARMRFMFGDKLRWVEIKEEKNKRTKKETVKDFVEPKIPDDAEPLEKE
jgi:hypothetical protein